MLRARSPASPGRSWSSGWLVSLLLLFCWFQIAVNDCRGQSTAAAAAEPQKQVRPRRVGDSPPPLVAPSPQGSPEDVDDGDVLRVNTELVTIPTTVTDKSGRPVTGLRAENFVVFEDGARQKISTFGTTDAPFEVALLLDTSGSTRADVALIQRAANSFIDSLRPGDRVALIAFNTAPGNDPAGGLATVDIKTKLTGDRAVLRRALESLGSSNGTPYYDALEQIATRVFNEPPRPEVRGRRAVVALTDGVDSTSHAAYQEARAALIHSGMACYFVEVNTEDFVEDRLLRDCQDDGTLRLSPTQMRRYREIAMPRGEAAADDREFCRLGLFERMEISRYLYNLARHEMDDLARQSGGRTFAAADLGSARAALAQVAALIGTEYSLGYYPSNKARDGRFRSIRVEALGVSTAAQVAAREGYYAPRK